MSEELLGTIVWQIMKFSCSLPTTLAVYRHCNILSLPLLFSLKLYSKHGTHFIMSSYKNFVKHLLHSTLNQPLPKLANTPNPLLTNTAERTERTDSWKWEQKRHKNTVALETDILQSIFMPSRRRYDKLGRPSIQLSTLLSKGSAKVISLYCPIIAVIFSIRLGSLYNLAHYLLFYPELFS